MARSAVRLLLALVLAAVLFHPDAAVEGKKQAPVRPEGAVPNYRCGACKVEAMEARSPVNKMLPITEKVCNKQVVADDFELDVSSQDEERSCNTECRTIIERAWQEVMKHHDDILGFIANKEKHSIQELMNFLCTERPVHVGEGNDNQSTKQTMIKNIGSHVKNFGHKFVNFLQKTEEPMNRANACKNLKAFLERNFT